MDILMHNWFILFRRYLPAIKRILHGSLMRRSETVTKSNPLVSASEYPAEHPGYKGIVDRIEPIGSFNHPVEYAFLVISFPVKESQSLLYVFIPQSLAFPWRYTLHREGGIA